MNSPAAPTGWRGTDRTTRQEPLLSTLGTSLPEPSCRLLSTNLPYITSQIPAAIVPANHYNTDRQQERTPAAMARGSLDTYQGSGTGLRCPLLIP